MENLKENLLKLKDLNKQLLELATETKDLERNTDWTKLTEEAIVSKDNEIKRNKNHSEILQVEKAIIKNNLVYLLAKDFGGIRSKIQNYFLTKRIGEKTKEKIENEIKEYYKENYQVNIGCWLRESTWLSKHTFELHFYFLNEEGFKDYTLEYNEELEISTVIENGEIIRTEYYRDIKDYVELSETRTEAMELLNQYEAAKTQIEQLRQQQREIYHNFKDQLNGFTYEKLDLDSNISIY